MAEINIPKKVGGQIKDISGRRFGRLEVVGFSGFKGPNAAWECRCDCGNTCIRRSTNLLSGSTRSCGCLAREFQTKHGMWGTPEYKSWSNAKSRCFNPKTTRFANHGGRGITMCDRWAESFNNFYEDMGPCPPKHTLDRINNDGNYEPGNCRWVDLKTQARNQRRTIMIVHEGVTMPITQLAEITGIFIKTLTARHKRGVPLLGPSRYSKGLKIRLPK